LLVVDGSGSVSPTTHLRGGMGLLPFTVVFFKEKMATGVCPL
jgi:hypothetical protein